MSTRSALAYIPKKDEVDHWTGVYCHWDGYPTNRGKQIWSILHEQFLENKGRLGVSNNGEAKNAINAFIAIYIKGHKAGWSSFPDECYCHDPAFVLRDGVRNMTISWKNPDPLSIEWVYVLNPETHTLRVYAAQSDKKEHNGPVAGKTTLNADGFWDYGHCAYRHVLVGEYDLLGPEPDWEKIEKKGGE